MTSGPDEFNADGTDARSKSYYWAQDSTGNIYLNEVAQYLDLGNSPYNYSHETATVNTRDPYGNVTQSLVYDYGNTSSPKWTYNSTYLSGTYTSLYIRNRLTSATVTLNNVNTTLVTKQYDTCGLTDPGGLTLHDASHGASFTYRGNLTNSSPDNHSYCYQVSGVVNAVTDGMNRTVTTSPNSGTNYSLPGTLTPSSNSNLGTSVSYASSWAVTSVAAPNGATSTTTYDSFGRPASSQSADGVVTTYSYTYNPNTQTATISNPPENPGGTKWKITTLDGFGRTIRVQTGHDNVTVSSVDTQYGPCACSPLGKMSAVSQPYAPGDTEVWTTYTHDGIGRTVTVTAPDGSVTSYSYAGNSTTITDPAGKWKTQTTDALGNLVQVTEPNPAGGANFVTSYTYDGMNHLTGVTLTRPEGTQTRSFNYNNGPDLVSATNPENGTVTYTYDAAHEVTSRTDALGQQTQYSYDAYGRLSEVRHYIGGGSEDLNQRWDYTYDSNTVDSTFTANNLYGRLASVQFGARDGSAPGYLYEYSYNQAGRITNQREQVSSVYSGSLQNGTDTFSATNLDAVYTWDNEGRRTAVQYPSQTGTPAQFSYQYDVMGRPSELDQTYCSGTDSNGNCTYSTAPEVENALYNATGLMTNLTWANDSPWSTETFTYNSLLQLTHDTVPGYLSSSPQMDMQYVYTAGQDNGRIAQVVDNVSGQTINYTYDALNRLTAAAATGGQWGQAYTYDGFGNLTSKTVTAGSGSNWSNTSDPSSNRLIGQSYDANGNAQFNGTSYDVENRLTARIMTQSPQDEQYQYDPMGHRVGKLIWDGVYPTTKNWELYFYDITGQQAAVITPQMCGPNYNAEAVQPFCFGARLDAYFGGRQVMAQGRWVLTDRLGSVREISGANPVSPTNYLPYGEEQTTPLTPDDVTKFGTYFRDRTVDNQDYADQRYYNPWMGRFNSADPIAARAVDPNAPSSWNMYTYAGGDPVNRNDQTGTDDSGLCQLDWYLDGSVPAECGGDFSWNGPFPPIPGCGGIQPDQFNPGIGMACLALLQATAPQQAAPPPSCEDTETAYVVSYLDQYSASSPLLSYAQTIVDDSDAAGVDDRFIIALAGQESSYGTNITRGPYNAWNNLAHTANHNPYSSWNSAISGVVNLITGGLYFGSGLNTTDSIYAKYNNSNPRTNPQFLKQLASLNSIYLNQLGGGLLPNPKEVDFSRCTPGN